MTLRDHRDCFSCCLNMFFWRESAAHRQAPCAVPNFGCSVPWVLLVPVMASLLAAAPSPP